jgi:hypothetical protein
LLVGDKPESATVLCPLWPVKAFFSFVLFHNCLSYLPSRVPRNSRSQLPGANLLSYTLMDF